eukprot:CAMPEP_0117022136 /NCGR_PEP_ID=MMETSP0472-20121206/16665_1 /TAXON_ID=693140 ORGANISM="Tiarina fusus, Strain LIS" /NCGR_SAMPLE_ID=MMETSP0472 /ASSEMBLY_ACC=CAM_ASM_000603 /LENGTH=36 /DNA_ID= /DNA_START= /DNA_END= /DNA_ORIENTATION=
MGMEEVGRLTNGIDGVRLVIPENKFIGSEACLSGHS